MALLDSFDLLTIPASQVRVGDWIAPYPASAASVQGSALYRVKRIERGIWCDLDAVNLILAPGDVVQGYWFTLSAPIPVLRKRS